MDQIFQLPAEFFTHVIQDILNNLYESTEASNTCVEPHIIKLAKEDIKNLIITSNYDLTNVAYSLQSKGWHQDKLNVFLAELKNRKTELLYSTLIYHNSMYGDTVTDFDWILKLVLGTNELKALNYPLLQLLLSTNNSKGEQKHTVYDVNKDMLVMLINLLENIEGI